jgi:hypothetical protein
MRPGHALRNGTLSVATFEYVHHDMGVVLTVRSFVRCPDGREVGAQLPIHILRHSRRRPGALVAPSLESQSSRGAGRAAGPGPPSPGLILQMARGAVAAARTSLGVVRGEARPRPPRSPQAR